MPQFFKGDVEELKFYDAGKGITQQLLAQKKDFFDEAFSTYALGDMLFDTGRAPLSNAIPRQIFREVFATLFDAFLQAGSFESYLTVFRNVFGSDVEVEFEVPSPGKLLITVAATGLQTSDFRVRELVGDVYQFDVIVDQEGDRIVFRTVKGLESEAELERMLFEMVPAGIYTQITLTIGG